MTEPVGTPDLWPDSPWADDEPSAERPAAGGLPTASRSLLRISLVVLIASTIVIFLSAVASSNSAANSPAEQIALVLHRASMLVMLVAFVGILAAYRLPALMAFLKARSGERSVAVDAEQKILTPEIWFLLMASGMLIAWVWAAAWSGNALMYQMTSWILLISAGLLANMVILHKGCVRSFAVGTLVTMILVLFTWRSILPAIMLSQGRFGLGPGADLGRLLMNFGIEVTLSILSGLICAFYYNFVIRVRSRVDQPPATVA